MPVWLFHRRAYYFLGALSRIRKNEVARRRSSRRVKSARRADMWPVPAQSHREDQLLGSRSGKHESASALIKL
ncbi:hypothetical protein PGTUg99_008305 [Puccinia graminis f. sp. tritici]|uniref:Uncharacterized protein n=1 Tax=Puccinia graminis f. sp. tritici TaxID=56615 RepID=A0A5B0RCH7_PUCGR|nr:hypothetical protein PGTUg99_008305 [Puccinia graminis f. sp. tritici]